MKELIILEDNVQSFQEVCAKLVGKRATEDFDIELYHRVQDNNISSPIEQLFINAFECIRTINGFPENYCFTYNDTTEKVGTIIFPQFQIEKYRVDFLIYHTDPEMVRNGSKGNKVVVELDGHDFHDKNEKQRRYEKKRDRFLQNLGLKVFHYTGAEVVSNPFVPASEVLGCVTGEGPKSLLNVVTEYLED